MIFDTHDPRYWDSADLEREFTRIVEICHGCRLCDGLCPPFTDLFDRIDAEDDKLTASGTAHADPVLELKKADYDHTVDYCYQCKLCYPKCPYTPPHEYQLDFPRLLLRADAIKTKEHGETLKQTHRDQLTGDTDRAGKIGAAVPGLMNWAGRNKLGRVALESVAGTDRSRRPLLHVHGRPEQTVDRPAVCRDPRNVWDRSPRAAAGVLRNAGTGNRSSKERHRNGRSQRGSAVAVCGPWNEDHRDEPQLLDDAAARIRRVRHR